MIKGLKKQGVEETYINLMQIIYNIYLTYYMGENSKHFH